MVEDKMTKTERCYRDDYLTSVDGYVEALANLGKINSMVKDLNKRFDFVLADKDNGYTHKSIYASARAVSFFDYTYDEMQQIKRHLGIGKMDKEQSSYDVTFSTEWEGIKLRFSFSTPKTCTMKYKTVRKKVDQIETDSNGDTYVLEDVFDGYDCSEKSMITALKEQK